MDCTNDQVSPGTLIGVAVAVTMVDVVIAVVVVSGTSVVVVGVATVVEAKRVQHIITIISTNLYFM